MSPRRRPQRLPRLRLAALGAQLAACSSQLAARSSGLASSGSRPVARGSLADLVACGLLLAARYAALFAARCAVRRRRPPRRLPRLQLAARSARLAARSSRLAARGSRLAARGSRLAARGSRLAPRGPWLSRNSCCSRLAARYAALCAARCAARRRPPYNTKKTYPPWGVHSLVSIIYRRVGGPDCINKYTAYITFSDRGGWFGGWFGLVWVGLLCL